MQLSRTGAQESLHPIREGYLIINYLRLSDRKDNAISRRYDGLTGSRWLITVVQLFHEGYISEEDINDFSDETKAVIKMTMS